MKKSIDQLNDYQRDGLRIVWRNAPEPTPASDLGITGNELLELGWLSRSKRFGVGVFDLASPEATMAVAMRWPNKG